MSGRRVAAAAVVAALAPLVVGLATVQPATAAPLATAAPAYDQYGLTAIAAGIRTGGDVGASGGLVTLDSGSAYVAARLDASPSANVLAAPYEPGTLVRTVAGQVNAQAGDEVVTVPDAEAAYPGTGSGALETVPPQSAGPLSTGSGAATAKATDSSAAGTATGSALSLTGVLESGTSSSSVQLTAKPETGVVTSTARSEVSRVLVAGVLELRDVVATAGITTAGDKHTSIARLTIGGASVAGQEVAVDQDGVHAVGTPILPAQTLQDATKQANAVLAAAGVEVHATEAVHKATTRSAEADTGGLTVTVATPELPGGVAANHLTVVLGGISLTETDTLPQPALGLPLDLGSPVPPAAGTGPVTTTTIIPGTPGTPGSAPGPTVAAPAVAPTSFLVGGRRLTAAAALAAFGVWQFLTLGTATLYAVVERRRRLAGLA
jgi:hypothetical protein